MRIALIIFCFTLAGCGSNSSPEGRITNKMEEIRKELDTLQKQNDALKDSVSKASKELDSLKEKLSQ
jgi:uncharacterized protein YlxW (UPF0749 family)